MHLPTLFYSLATLTLTTAVPFASQASTVTPTPTPIKPMVAPSAPPSVASSAASYEAPSWEVDTPMTPVGPYQCPQKQSKRCCMSLEQTSRMLIKGLGDLVPPLGSISVSSPISFQCKDMADDVSPNDCDQKGYAPMCCNPEGGSGISSCKPFEEAKETYYKSFGYNKHDQTKAEYIEDAVL